MWAELAFILSSYLLGAFPLLYILSTLRGLGLRMEDDMHLGLWRKGGRLLGSIGLLWDVVKGAIPVIVGLKLGLGAGTIAIGGVAVVAGQMWSAFLRFNGEKGNSTGLGMALALSPKAFPLAGIPVLIGIIIRTVPRLLNPRQSLDERLKLGGPPSRSLPLGMLLGFAFFPLSAWWLEEEGELVLAFLALFLLIALKRLTAGLTQDLRSGDPMVSILLHRLFFDRRD